MENISEIVTQLLEVIKNSSSIIAAVIGGAFGAFILELYWKPKRNRRRGAIVFLAEILNNTEILLIQANARLKNPKAIPADFKLETQGWDAAKSILPELPQDLIKNIMRLYSRYRYLNWGVKYHSRLFDKYSNLTDLEHTESNKNIFSEVVATIDAFNMTLDKTIEQAKSVMPHLLKITKIKKAKSVSDELRDYAKDTEEYLLARGERISEMIRKNEGVDRKI